MTPHYAARYSGFARMTLDAGVLDIQFHSSHQAWVLTATSRDLFVPLFFDIANDKSVRVVMVRGTGDVFCEQTDPTSLMDELSRFGPEMLDNWRSGGNQAVRGLLNIEAPVIVCLNGHLRQHAEIWMAADFVLAAPGAEVQDFHVAGGQVPGGDARVVWETLLGHSRATRFLMLGESLVAEQLRDWGVVHRVVEKEGLVDAARDIAMRLTALNVHVLRYSKASLVERLRQQLALEQPYTQALVMLGAHSSIPELLKKTSP